MKFFCAFLALATICSASWIYQRGWTKQERFNRFIEKATMELILPDPELLSNLGIADNAPFDFFSGRLTDISFRQNVKNLQQIRKVRAKLHQFDREGLPAQEQLTYDIFDHFLGNILDSASFGYGSYESFTNAFLPYPVNQLFGVQNTLPDFMANMHRITDRKSAKRYLARLDQWEKKFKDLTAELALREKNGVLLPKFLIGKVLEESRGFIHEPAESNLLYTTFQTKLDGLELSQASRKRLERSCLAAIEHKVYPSYQRLIAFLEGQFQRASDDAGVWKFPNGEAYYLSCLRFHTTTLDTPDEVHALGLSEVARIQGEMRQILNRLGYQDLSIKEAMQKIAQSPQSLYPDSEAGRKQLLADYHAILDQIQGKLSQLFSRLPKAELKIEPVPDYKAKTAPFAYYEPGDLLGERPGVFFVNTYDMRNQTKFTMPTLAYHEGLPGHHLQIARAQEIPNLPTFRRTVNFNAYAEGWALYCEKLASEYDFTAILHHDLGRLQYELMRAVRLVVDTGIHQKRWTRTQAIQYMANATGQNENEVAIEIDRYMVLPGQACSYKIGMLKLLELREKMRAHRGSDFDIREFHEIVLQNGSMPLSLLEKNLDKALINSSY